MGEGGTAVIAQMPLLGTAPVTAESIPVDGANALLVAWGHRLGPCNRPFSQRAYALLVDGEPISLAISASAVSGTVAGYRRDQVVELARLCSVPGGGVGLQGDDPRVA